MTPSERIIYNMLVNAAERGDTCPTNSIMSVSAGLNRSGVIVRMNKLIAAGCIVVERTMRSRVVTIIATGKSTRPTALHRGAFARADDLAELVANGTPLQKAHLALGCSPERVRQLWAAIKARLGWQAQ